MLAFSPSLSSLCWFSLLGPARLPAAAGGTRAKTGTCLVVVPARNFILYRQLYACPIALLARVVTALYLARRRNVDGQNGLLRGRRAAGRAVMDRRRGDVTTVALCSAAWRQTATLPYPYAL